MTTEKRTTEKQVRTNIEPELHEEVIRAARRLGIHIKVFFADAIKAKLGKFDVDMKNKKLRAENTTLSAEKEQFRSERDEAKRKLNTADNQSLHWKEEADRLDREKTAMRTQRDDAVRQRDHFKDKFEREKEAVGKLEADMEAYRGRGLIDRVFNVDASG